MKTAMAAFLLLAIGSMSVARAGDLSTLGYIDRGKGEIIPANCPPPPCPDVQVTCNCAGMELEGLFRVNINGVVRCGKITIIQNGFLLEEGGPSIDIQPTSAGKVFFLSNAWKRLERVQSCD